MVACATVKAQGLDYYFATAHLALLLCNGKKDRSFVTVHLSTKKETFFSSIVFVVFFRATSFNTDLTSWDVSKVVDMEYSEYAAAVCLSA